MDPEQSPPSEKTSLLTQSESGLANISSNDSPALSEIMSRSLIHIQTNKILTTRHRIGSHELCDPDYRLVCSWAEELRVTQEDVFERLIETNKNCPPGWRTVINDGEFKSLSINGDNLPISGIPAINGLKIAKLRLRGFELTLTTSDPKPYIRELDLSSVPYLTALDCDLNSSLEEIDLGSVPRLQSLFCRNASDLLELDLSLVPRLRALCCDGKEIARIDFSAVPDLLELVCGSPEEWLLSGIWNDDPINMLDLRLLPKLKYLDCSYNRLAKLDLIGVPHLETLRCSCNQLTALNLANVCGLTILDCSSNLLRELDIRPLKYLEKIECDFDDVRIIQRPDQNFK